MLRGVRSSKLDLNYNVIAAIEACTGLLLLTSVWHLFNEIWHTEERLAR